MAGADVDPASGLIGREALSARLAAAVDRACHGVRTSVVVTGTAGIGKTSLVRAAAAQARARGVRIGWGTAVEGGGAPGHWPWTQALTGLARAVGADRAVELAGDDVRLLAALCPVFGRVEPAVGDERLPMELMDATARWLDAAAEDAPVLVVLDDVQWADDASLALLEFAVGWSPPAAVGVVAVHRDDEVAAPHRARLRALLPYADHVPVSSLDEPAVRALLERVIGRPVPPDVSAAVHRRSGGHPFLVRELALLPVASAAAPAAVRDAVSGRLRQLPGPTITALEVAAVAGTEVVAEHVAPVLRSRPADVEAVLLPALDAGVLVHDGTRARFAHDLFRETLEAALDPSRRAEVHRDLADALEARARAGADVVAADLARHACAAVQLDGAERAGRWALAAADADRAAVAFSDAAAHLRRFRAAVSAAGAPVPEDLFVDVLLSEADALDRAGRPVDARGLLRVARDVAVRSSDARREAAVALAAARLGSRFAARRDEVVRDLEAALATGVDGDAALQARLTATLARELQHSVAEDRPRAGPLSERALQLGRQAADPTTLLDCLLARHDVLWTPGSADERVPLAREIVAVARAAGDAEHEAQGLLLLADAELERGSAAYAAALESCLLLLDALGQPRQRYVAATRRAAVALLRGELDDAAALITSAAALGERIREPDAGNVAMSQRLELVRARRDAAELRAFADAAVAHWTGAPVHAHAVAAGFCARSGGLDRARQHVAAVLDLGSWRMDRSYLWPVLVRELGQAAVALEDEALCGALLADLLPLAGTCAVNGAVVAFGGSLAHTAGVLTAALGRSADAAALLRRARDTYARLGATGWLAEATADLDALDAGGAAGPRTAARTVTARLERAGAVWHVTYADRRGTLPDAKGLADLAELVRRPGRDVPALELAGSLDRSGPAGHVIDRTALRSYRQRLADLEEDAAAAAADADDGRATRIAVEREALLGELRRTTTLRGGARTFSSPAERARKAVSARIRAAIAGLEPVLPELAAHLDRSVVTGTQCRYRPDEGVVWEVVDGSRRLG